MFRQINNGANWYILLMLLSLEKTDTFLTDIVFPVEIDVNLVRPVARGFVEQFRSNLDTVHLRKDCELAQADLLNKTYLEFLEILDKDRVDRFCSWGNQFEIDTDLERSLSLIWDFILKPLLRGEHEPLPLTQHSMEILLSMLKLQREKERVFLLRIDEAQSLPRNTWEERAIWIYNGGTIYTPRIEDFLHPYDYLFGLVNLLELPPLLKELQTKIGVNEFELLNEWVNDELQKRNFHLLGLNAILARI